MCGGAYNIHMYDKNEDGNYYQMDGWMDKGGKEEEECCLLSE